MSGAWAVALALALCPHGVSVFGLSTPSTTTSGAANLRVPYHYYDARAPNQKLDNVGDSARAIVALAAREPECVRLWSTSPSPSDGAQEEVPARVGGGSARVDPLVDGLRGTAQKTNFTMLRSLGLGSCLRGGASRRRRRRSRGRRAGAVEG